MESRLRLVLLCLLSSLAFGQEFEAASIKLSPPPTALTVQTFPGPVEGGPGSSDPTHMRWNFLFLRILVQAAYDVQYYQIKGPTDILQQQFDFSVLVPKGATPAEVRIMWRNLLVSRFHMKAHVEQKEFETDELVVGPRGHKLRPNAEEGESEYQPYVAGTTKTDSAGRPVLSKPGLIFAPRVRPDGTSEQNIVARAQSPAVLLGMLEGLRGHRVVDHTGLTGGFDFSLTTSLLSRPGEEGTLQYDLEQQLGLRLVKGKAMLDYVVIDSIDQMPTEN